MRSFQVTCFVAALLAPTLSAQDLFDRDLGTNLGLGDESNAEGLALGFSFPFDGVGYGHVSVCSNGYLWLGATAGGASDPTPTLLELSNAQPRLAPLWTDLDPSAPGSGNVWFKAMPGKAVISWAGVYEKGAAIPVDFQVRMYATGHIEVAYGKNRGASTTPVDRLVGSSTGGGAPITAVNFDSHPFLVTSYSFAEIWSGTAAFPFVDTLFDWSPSFPGYAISHVPSNPNSLPPPARFDVVGKGCVYRAISLYGVYDISRSVPSMDLLFTPNGLGGYVVTRSFGRTQPTGLEVVLPAGDDTLHLVQLPFYFPHVWGNVNQIQVSSNGYVTLGGTDPSPRSPGSDASEFFHGPACIAGFWTDLNPLLGGAVSTIYDPNVGSFAVAWDNVPENPNRGANSFRIVFQMDGSFRIQLLQVGIATFSNKALIGYTDGYGAADPMDRDLASVPMPMDLGAHVDPLKLVANPGSLPVIGRTFVMKAENLRGLLCYLALGDEVPGIDLGLIGAPRCSLRVSMQNHMALVNLVFGAPETDFVIPVPNDIFLAGQVLMSQAAGDAATEIGRAHV